MRSTGIRYERYEEFICVGCHSKTFSPPSAIGQIPGNQLKIIRLD
jgi:hypothetical protein